MAKYVPIALSLGILSIGATISVITISGLTKFNAQLSEKSVCDNILLVVAPIAFIIILGLCGFLIYKN